MTPPPVLRILVLGLLALALPGCLSRAARMQSLMEPWVGRNVSEAVSQWGPPAQTYPNGERTIYLWSSSGPTVAVASTHFSDSHATTFAAARTNECRYWFDTTSLGVIIGWSWEGQCS